MTRAAAPARAAVLALGAALGTACHPAPRPAADGTRMLDDFEDLTGWRAIGSDGVTSAIGAVPGVHGRALRLAVDLGGTAGYGVARRAIALELPADFTLSFELRGDIPPNNLELKLIDDTGDNVWWFRRASYEFPASWRHITVERRQIEFAWGPTADRTLRRIAAIELVVSAAGGGKGWIEVDDLAIDPVPAVAPAPRAAASSWLPGGEPGRAIDGDPATAWASDPATGARQGFTLDLGRERALGGLIVRWADGGAATDYRVELSRDGTAWQPVDRVADGDGGLDPFVLPESGARFVRLAIAAGPARGYRLAELVPIDAGGDGTWVARGNALVAALAAGVPRGGLPRAWSGEQTYWTVVGIDGGAHNSLLSEDGALEIGGGASLEPFVEIAGHAVGWAGAAAAGEIHQALDDGYLPIPSVTWRMPGWELAITALAAGAREAAHLAARYTLRNPGDAALTARLVLAVRPLQVDPPTQRLGRSGGVHRIARIAWQGGELALDGAPALRPVTPPDRVALWPLHALGYPLAALPAAPGPPAAVDDPRDATRGGVNGPAAPGQPPAGGNISPLPIDDPSGMASGALVYDLAIPPHGTASVVVAAALTGALPAVHAPGWFDAQRAAARAAWHDRLDRVGFRVPAAGQPIIDTLRTSLAYMLVSRDGPILRPGTRSYARAWIRDGAMIGEALLRLGHPGVAAEFLRWYAPYQDASGKVPCCVEASGAVPVPEHDSHGELIHLAAEVFRYTGDRALAAELWPRVQAAARYLDALRGSERSPANRTAARRALWGLLPPSISHEGYSDRPAYSYWDDFWALAGYRDAAALASALGDPAAARRLADAHDELQRDVVASIAASAAAHGVDYIPGAADRGDFDATSTTIALSPGGALDALPADRVRATFERAWQTLADRRDHRRPTADAAYTPYELRLVGAFVRLGWRDRAGAALAAYLADRRPAAWNQWAEVVGDDPRAPRFVGDMPHAWVHSDYARAVLDLFACERDRDHAWLIAAGIPAGWFDGDGLGAGLGAGFAIDALATPFGPLSYQVTATRDALTVAIGPGELPAGGLVFPWPLAAPPGAARIDGAPVAWRTAAPLERAAPEIAIDHRPATLVIARTAAPRRP
jgi:hypothetical protein